MLNRVAITAELRLERKKACEGGARLKKAFQPRTTLAGQSALAKEKSSHGGHGDTEDFQSCRFKQPRTETRVHRKCRRLDRTIFVYRDLFKNSKAKLYIRQFLCELRGLRARFSS